MTNSRMILCGESPGSSLPLDDPEPLSLHLLGPGRNVNLNINIIRDQMLRDIPAQFIDLLEIAAYVYSADQAVSRGTENADSLGQDWRRRLFYRIPVRHPDLWQSTDLYTTLVNTLNFLSEDEYTFEFTELKEPPALQEYLSFAEEGMGYRRPEEVILFSGGLDSLGGAIQESIIDRNRVVLVSHRSTPKLARRHSHLVEQLTGHAGELPPVHIPVVANKSSKLTKDTTQRSRSFLYAALGATVARMLDLDHIKFYENGVVSLNLPIAPQVVGAKCTRTTHPQVIKGFENILSLVSGQKFKVETPFLWKTKTEVVELITKAGCSDLIKYATSCSHTRSMINMWSHCGTCSQCIDRRFAVLAAGQEEADPEIDYEVDLIKGERKENEPRIMLASYVETANEIRKMSSEDFICKYGEIARVLRYIDGASDSVALKIYDMYKRHASAVTGVIDCAIARHASDIREMKLPSNCLVRLICDASGSVPAEPVVVGSVIPVLGYNVFRKEGQGWLVRFAGAKPFILVPSVGTAYFHQFMSEPRTATSVIDRVYGVLKEPAQFLLGDGGDIMDRDAMSAYRARYDDLKKELEEAEENDDLARQQTIRMEMEWLNDELKKNVDIHGRSRKASDDRTRVRKAFYAAIRRTRDKIALEDKALAEHLKPPRLRCGHYPVYDPMDDIRWDT